MKLRIRMGVLAWAIFGAIFALIPSTYANYDYVCSYYKSSCDCTWETNWREDGTKHCVGTRTDITRIGNTRVGCPGSDYGSEAYRNYGGYMYGDIKYSGGSCELVMHDNIAPEASIDSIELTSNGIIGYKKQWCVGSTCDFPLSQCTKNMGIVSCESTATPPATPESCSGLSGSGSCQPVYGNTTIWEYDVGVTCGDTWNIIAWKDVAPGTVLSWNTKFPDNTSFGNAWCNISRLPSRQLIKKGEAFDFTVYDKAGNSRTCSIKNQKSWSNYEIASTCASTNIPAWNKAIPANESNCTRAGGGSCYPDHIKPEGNISYTPPSCTNQDVTVTIKCTKDNGDPWYAPSGCRWKEDIYETRLVPGACTGDPYGWITCAPDGYSQVLVESQHDFSQDQLLVKQNQAGTLGITDAAGNLLDLPYNVTNIDKVAPTSPAWGEVINFIDSTDPENPIPLGATMQAGKNTMVLRAFDANIENWSICNGKLLANITVTDKNGSKTTYTDKQIPRDGSLGLVGVTLNVAWDTLIHTEIRDLAGNIFTADKTVKVYPSSLDEVKSSLEIVGNRKDKYADGVDVYTYKLTLRDSLGNAIYNKTLQWLDQDGDKTIKTDMSNPSSPQWDDAILETLWTTNSNGEVTFQVSSIAPGVFSESFGVAIPNWGNDYMDISGTQSIRISTKNENSFRKLYVGQLKVTTPPNTLSVGTVLATALVLAAQKPSVPTSFTIGNFENGITIFDSLNQRIEQKANEQGLSSLTPSVDFRIEAITDQWTAIAPRVFIKSNPTMAYTIEGKSVTYRVSGTDAGDDTTEISLGGEGIMGLNILWSSQSKWKAAVVGESVPFSDISAQSMRNQIRKSAYQLIRGLKSWDTVNGIHYREGDYTLSDVTGYETLIIKDGNLTIDSNYLNANGGSFGIIVLRDTQQEKGNIYVKPNVHLLRSVIYADGALMSVGSNGVPFSADSANRTSVLQNQLVIRGSLFTYNTIGGAVLGSSGKYILPGGQETTDYGQALQYDLYYTRRGNTGWDKTAANGWTSEYNDARKDPFVIIQDSKLQTNPPKGFY